MSGISRMNRTTANAIAGSVRTYFQLRSHQRCMKNMTTRNALAAEMVIKQPLAVYGDSAIKLELAIQYDTPVNPHSIANTATNVRVWVVWP